ncbi:Isopenicillin N epimerase [Planctomycetes bacterium Poly30]|uniref:Isopenicillin N epimerase n=1 Tax=Saltatorellus ferox TaxID=2528018 RepID=A0A518F0E6_9BACT|nr:Isopenicillin N epimerase [Planctomycetes bacterium Poly30]
MTSTRSAYRSHWGLNPDVTFLNHGSFGASPRVVLEAQRRLQDELESDPIRWLAPERDLEKKLDPVRERLSDFLGCRFEDLAFVRNATDGVNAVLRSFPFEADDEILVTSHGYNACTNAARFVAGRAGARVTVADIPFPCSGPDAAVEAIEAAFTSKTRLLLVDYVTSPTALILPLARIIEAAHARGIRVLVDAAHAAGMVKVELDALGADYTTGNLHKWLCGPKVAGYLHVRPEHQAEVRPTVISHAANTPRPARSRFLAEFDWTGTFDPTPLLAVPVALDFLENVIHGGGIEAVYAANRALALEGRRILTSRLGLVAPAPEEMLGSIVTLPLPDGPPPEIGRTDTLGQRLFETHRIEVPIVHWPAPGKRWFRISAMLYNDATEYERLGDALESELTLATR